jgi:hypothetical protein
VAATVVIVVVAGVAVVGYHDHLFSLGGPTASATLALGPPSPGSVLCSSTGEVYYYVVFPIQDVVGTPTTGEFGLTIFSATNSTVPPNGSAPLPQPDLPCAAPIPAGWYAELIVGLRGTVATFPVPGLGTLPAWSNASAAPISLTAGEEFEIVTDGDFTGTGDHIATFSTGTTAVHLSGNTTFPAYRHP